MDSHSCYRHNPIHKSFDFQQSQEQLECKLSRYCPESREKLNELWNLFTKLPGSVKNVALDGILLHSCFPQLSYLSNVLPSLVKVDFISHLPNELAFRVFQYLDGKSLCHAAQVCRLWRMRADDDLLWNRMCHQHINKKCDKCGWGLPLMQSRPHKRVKLDIPIQTKTDCFKPIDFPTNEPPRTHKRPWKSVYAERMVVERHWRKPQFSTRTLTGHTDGVMAVYFDKDLLVTGSFDASIRVWDVSTGECLAVLRGHGRCVRGVQFDDNKIVSCSMDRTLRIWCRKSFNCVRVLSNDSGVNCLHFEDKMLASGTVDGNIKVWNLARGCSFTLSGHSDWVNKVKIMPCHERLISCSDDTTMRLWDIATQSVLRVFSGHNGPVQALQFKDGHSDQERRLITGSLDNTVKIWNLGTGECEKTLFGHEQGVWCIGADSLRIISGSHDKTVKVWDMCSGNLLHSLKADAAVNACWLSDTMLITGDDAGQVIVRDFLNL